MKHLISYLLIGGGFLIINLTSKCGNEAEILYPEGGSPYKKDISSRDSNDYFLPLRYKFQPEDSLRGFFVKYFYEGFKEENLSLAPPKVGVFRFTFVCGFCGKAAIIKIKRNEIVIKKNIRGYAGVTIEFDKLTQDEYNDYRIIERYYPYTLSKFSESVNPKNINNYKKYYDSIVLENPRLNDQEYFEKLKFKASVYYKMDSGFTTMRIAIPDSKYRQIVNNINNSGFWQRPISEVCSQTPMDGDGFALEAATQQSYHLVYSNYCIDERDKSKFLLLSEYILKIVDVNIEDFYLDGCK